MSSAYPTAIMHALKVQTAAEVMYLAPAPAFHFLIYPPRAPTWQEEAVYRKLFPYSGKFQIIGDYHENYNCLAWAVQLVLFS
jgi:hypothetical protein